MTQWLRRLALLFPANRRRKERDLEEELQSHLELATDDSEPGNEAVVAVIKEAAADCCSWLPEPCCSPVP